MKGDVLALQRGVTVTGIEELVALFSDIAPREAVNLAKVTILDIAKQVAKDAIENAPDDPSTGGIDLRRSIKAERRDSKSDRAAISAVVGIKRSGKNTPYYWRFLEYGQGPDHVEHAYFLKAEMKLSADLPQILEAAFLKKYLALLARKQRKAAKAAATAGSGDGG